MFRRAALLLALAALAAPNAAVACSVSPSPEIRAEQYKDDPENRRVKGHFSVTETLINGYGRGIIRGRIETARGTGWDVWVDYDEFMIDCVYFFAPTIDATGTFWIARRAVDGRYEIRLWEGEYTPEALERHRRAQELAEAQEPTS
ncbi:MAG: hypothetical protein EDM03_14800 [Porphyrobacter sp. IPPAS B-1204]|nr:MAG: hypothetical protein EDM03_14800 [Porphyrobacter sp. IPPAS B-1204]